MALFNKKKTEENVKKEADTTAAPVEEKKGPSIHNVKVPTAKAAAPEATPAKAAPSATKVAAKPLL